MTTYANDLDKPAVAPAPTPALTYGINLNYPKLRLYYYSLIASDTVLFYAENGENLWFKGPVVGSLLPQLLPLLTGTFSIDQLIAKLGADKRRDVVNVLKLLKDRRIIEEGQPDPTLALPLDYIEQHRSQLTFLSHYSNDTYRTQAHLLNARVTILNDGTHFGAELMTNLAASGLGELRLVEAADLVKLQLQGQTLEDLTAPHALATRLGHIAPETHVSAHKLGYEWVAPPTHLAPPLGTPDSYAALEPLVKDASLVVVLTEGYSTRLCDVVNEVALEHKVRWINVSLKGAGIQIGPGIVPHTTACWRCYQARVWSNQAQDTTYAMLEQFDEYYHTQGERQTFGRLPFLGSLAAGMGASEILKALTLFWPPLYGQVLLFDPISTRSQTADVLRLPRCKACGRDRKNVPMKLWHTTRPSTRGLNG